ncbi:ubiquinol-cytochrome c reductase iron-sulfur subunit [Entomobacter blattae]|uniref:Ubiquinol-cytochrome c reductase iron-sulfur subunit n=1 Tax=Entomobacter blattae TaxID=2762277 RepID=A0A7H1NNQ9_9PROT|nr:ubiquinol-cytochrome c reductase iron-sulfur subunit [Entomobacter blattae]QNT77419.1 Cytochrome b6-f complex iron-sulfur subunit [Entomobacter blattae]
MMPASKEPPAQAGNHPTREDPSPPLSDEEWAPRRNFLTLLTCASALTGAAALSWPFLKSLSPAETVESETLDVDLSTLRETESKTVIWTGKPVFIVKRSPADLATLQLSSHIAKLRDPDSLKNQQPSYARNWHRSLRPEIGVMVGICTHLGCIPSFQPSTPTGQDKMENAQYHCACHGSFYDSAGRVFKDVPAPLNLPIPPHHFLKPHLLRLGANPPGQDFDFNTIEQL